MALREFFHLIHIVNDEDEVDAWYDAVFSPQRFVQRNWLDLEKRWASLSMIGNFMIEVIEPSSDAEDAQMPLTKFRTRFGERFHSLAWYTDSGGIKPLFDSLRARGVRIAKPGGGIWPEGDVDPGPTIFTHPRDTSGQLEFVDVSFHWIDTDPRFQPGWSAEFWRTEHPLGIERVSHFTTLVTDLELATSLYEDALGATVVHRSESDDRLSAFVVVGVDTVVELAQPTGTSGPLAEDIQLNGELPYACTFRVRNLAAAEAYLEGLGLHASARAGDTLTLDPKDSFGAVYAFTDADVPGFPPTTPAA